MNDLPLEDNVGDVLGKARRGLGLEETALCEQAGLSSSQWEALIEGKGNPEDYAKVAPLLGLHAAALAGHGAYQPGRVKVEGFLPFTTDWEWGTVNAYLAINSTSKEAVLFDTTTDASAILETLSEHQLTLRLILLTHTHGDHILELDRIVERTGASAFVCEREALDGAQSFEAGRTFEVGGLSISTRQTSGHSPGGITYIIKGLERPVAVVGDALFAGSMGGAPDHWQKALSGGKEGILSLPPETVIAPGHGPMTTVAEERLHNPFFAASF